jgi:hypothetical protein
METSIHAAREALTQTKKRMATLLPKARLNEPLTLNAVTPYEQTFVSSVGREVRSF